MSVFDCEGKVQENEVEGKHFMDIAMFSLYCHPLGSILWLASKGLAISLSKCENR